MNFTFFIIETLITVSLFILVKNLTNVLFLKLYIKYSYTTITNYFYKVMADIIFAWLPFFIMVSIWLSNDPLILEDVFVLFMCLGSLVGYFKGISKAKSKIQLFQHY